MKNHKSGARRNHKKTFLVAALFILLQACDLLNKMPSVDPTNSTGNGNHTGDGNGTDDGDDGEIADGGGMRVDLCPKDTTPLDGSVELPEISYLGIKKWNGLQNISLVPGEVKKFCLVLTKPRNFLVLNNLFTDELHRDYFLNIELQNPHTGQTPIKFHETGMQMTLGTKTKMVPAGTYIFSALLKINPSPQDQRELTEPANLAILWRQFDKDPPPAISINDDPECRYDPSSGHMGILPLYTRPGFNNGNWFGYHHVPTKAGNTQTYCIAHQRDESRMVLNITDWTHAWQCFYHLAEFTPPAGSGLAGKMWSKTAIFSTLTFRNWDGKLLPKGVWKIKVHASPNYPNCPMAYQITVNY